MKFANAIPNSNNPFEYYMKDNKVQNSMYLTPSDPAEILKIISDFQAKKSTGHDQISMSFLKNISHCISYPISLIVNKSLNQGIFPRAMKLAKVVPIYKNKDKNKFDNYRPISLLPSISKITERVMHKRLYNFLTRNGSLSPTQFGFRSNHSTTDAVHC